MNNVIASDLGVSLLKIQPVIQCSRTLSAPTSNKTLPTRCSKLIHSPMKDAIRKSVNK
jgi:hypothetical protein